MLKLRNCVDFLKIYGRFELVGRGIKTLAMLRNAKKNSWWNISQLIKLIDNRLVT